MKDVQILCEIYVDKDEVNKHRTGYVTIKPDFTTKFDKISVRILYEVRGMMVASQKEIMVIELLENKTIHENEFLEIPFSFEVPETITDTYKGKNATFTYSCEARITVNSEDFKNYNYSLLSKLKYYLTENNIISASTPFEVFRPTLKYKVYEGKAKMELESFYLIGILAVILLAGIFTFSLMQLLVIQIILASTILLFILIGIGFYFYYLLGTVHIEILQAEDGFICKVNKSRNYKLSNQKVYFQIVEKVIDRRSTSSSSNNELIYHSETKEFTKLQEIPELKFNYPPGNNWASIVQGDASIVWIMNLEGKIMTIPFNHKCMFHVSRN